MRTPLWAIGIRLWAIGVAAALMAGCAVRAGATPDPVGAVGAPGSDTPSGDDGQSGGHADSQLDGQNDGQVDGEGDAGLPPAEPQAGESADAASAGGACHLLEFDLVAEVTGTRFDIAAASKRDSTHTCLLRPLADKLPELALSVTATSIDKEILREEVAPRGATSVDGLGRAGYQARIAASDKQPAAIEVGWLSGDQRLISLRYTLADGEDADALVPKLVALAQRIDAQRV